MNSGARQRMPTSSDPCRIRSKPSSVAQNVTPLPLQTSTSPPVDIKPPTAFLSGPDTAGTGTSQARGTQWRTEGFGGSAVSVAHTPSATKASDGGTGCHRYSGFLAALGFANTRRKPDGWGQSRRSVSGTSTRLSKNPRLVTSLSKAP